MIRLLLLVTIILFLSFDFFPKETRVNTSSALSSAIASAQPYPPAVISNLEIHHQ
ncbi:MAG: hypothetical protein HYV28_07365 [Ignavibacteriales bacterium]|nr:hypothetical protein [Ignavibacteriales bacterium]